MEELSVELRLIRMTSPEDPWADAGTEAAYLRVAPDRGPRVATLPLPDLRSRTVAARTTPDPNVAREELSRVASAMRTFLVALGWEEDERRVRAALSAGKAVSLLMAFDAMELFDLPWEELPFGERGLALDANPGVCIRWQVRREPPLPRSPAVPRILFAWSGSGGVVPDSEHRKELGDALSPNRTFPPGDELRAASLEALAAALEAAQAEGKPYTALHLLCHGVDVGGRQVLALDGPSLTDPVDGERLARTLLARGPALQLVVLCACRAGAAPEARPLGSVAVNLHCAGIPAVIAPPGLLSIAGSIQFTQAFYRALQSGHSIDQALQESDAVLAAASERTSADRIRFLCFGTAWVGALAGGRPQQGVPSGASSPGASLSPGGEPAAVGTPPTAGGAPARAPLELLGTKGPVEVRGGAGVVYADDIYHWTAQFTVSLRNPSDGYVQFAYRPIVDAAASKVLDVERSDQVMLAPGTTTARTFHLSSDSDNPPSVIFFVLDSGRANVPLKLCPLPPANGFVPTNVRPPTMDLRQFTWERGDGYLYIHARVRITNPSDVETWLPKDLLSLFTDPDLSWSRTERGGAEPEDMKLQPHENRDFHFAWCDITSAQPTSATLRIGTRRFPVAQVSGPILPEPAA